jgi:hypothetical protein
MMVILRTSDLLNKPKQTDHKAQNSTALLNHTSMRVAHSALYATGKAPWHGIMPCLPRLHPAHIARHKAGNFANRTHLYGLTAL